MYFLRRLRPLEVAGERVRSLRVSLNAPVLSTSDLPVGPARAVIVVHREARGRMDATVGVRSLRSGELAYWSFDGELTSEADLDVAADAALTFSESLGFLFDEAPIGAGAEAEKLFRAWFAGDEPGGSRGARGDVPEMMLDELMVEVPPTPALRPQQERSVPSATERPTRAPAALPPTPQLPLAPPPQPTSPSQPATKSLSKFRGREAVPAAGPARNAARQPLARVQLVKRRSPEEERKLLLRKLLTSF